MSQFCNVISKIEGNESKLEAPLTFGQLDSFCDWLGKEFLEAEADFIRKTSYVVQRDVLTNENFEILAKLNDEVRNYTLKLTIVDEEISQEEETIQELTEIVGRLERRFDINCPCTQSFQTDLSIALQQIESLDAQLQTASADMECVNEILAAREKALPTSRETENVITSIISLHLDLLLHIECSLRQLDENCESVEDQLRFLRQKQMQLLDNSAK